MRRNAYSSDFAAGADYIKLWVDDELKTMPKMPREISKAVIELKNELERIREQMANVE